MLAERDALETGVTLIEMLVVVSLMAIFVGVSFSGLRAGLSSLRLRSAASETCALFVAAANQAELKQEPVDVRIAADGGAIAARMIPSGYTRTLHLPEGVHITNPAHEHTLLYPGGGIPHVVLELVDERGAHQSVSP